MESRIAAFNKMQENFIVSRTHYEREVNAWFQHLGTLPQDLYERITSTIPVTKDMTLKDLVPEWWEKAPNKEIARQQVMTVNGYFEQADKIIEEIMNEGAKVSEEFTRLLQGGN